MEKDVKKKKNVYSCIAFLIILIIVLIGISNVFERKNSKNMYKMFYTNADKIDVLFCGPSVVLYGVYPVDLWYNYGIASYNVANESERLATTYWVIKNSLDYCKPQLVVVDMTALNWGTEKTDRTLKDHNYLDSVPISFNKIRTVMDLFPKEKRAEYLWNFVLYHSRWLEFGLQENDEINYQMGAQMRIGVQYNNQPQIGDRLESRSITDSDSKVEYMDKIVSLCKEENISLLFTFMPYRGRQGDVLLREFVGEYCRYNNVDYLDMLGKDIVDYRIDFIDDTHLNPAGARKVTRYLGKYISINYNIQDRRKDENYRIWNYNYEEYVKYKHKILLEEENLYNYMMLIDDEHYEIIYLTKEQTNLYEDEKSVLLLDSLNVKGTDLITEEMLEAYIWNNEKVEDNEKEGKYDTYREMLDAKYIPEDTNIELLFFVVDKEKSVLVDVSSFAFVGSFQSRKM